MIDVTSIPPIIGTISIPDPVGLTPFTTCRYNGKYVTDPNRANPTINPTADVTTKVCCRNRWSGSTGSVALRSTNANSTSDSNAITINPISNGDDHGYAVPPRSERSVMLLSTIARSPAPI